MPPSPGSRLTLLLALVTALVAFTSAPLSAAPGGAHGPPSWAGGGHNNAGGRDHGPGPPGGGGATPGGAIGGGLAGGVGGPTGGLGASHGRGGGGGGGGAAISPLSPNAAPMGEVGPGPSASVGHGRGHGPGSGGALSSLSPNAAAMDGGDPGGHGHKRGHGASDISPTAAATDHEGPGKALGVGHGQGLGRGGTGNLPPGLDRVKARGRDALQEDGDKGDKGNKGNKSDKGDKEDKGDKGKGHADDLIRQATETGETGEAAVEALSQARRVQARALIEAHRDLIEPDDFGRPVVRGEILAVAPSAAALARAQRAGFRILTRETLPGLDMESVVLRGPRGVGVVEALKRLRALDTAGRYDFNHLYQESGAVKARAVAAPARAVTTTEAASTADGVRIGLVDGGVAAGQPALSGAHIVQRGFAGARPVPSPHATAVASLMAGRLGRFRGAAPGATLFVADVYGSTPAGGSAEAIAKALAWLAEARAPVINISLVGPPNILLEAAVKALIAKGHVVVAAVGNDGPAAPPLYPASYPGVVAVTAVDSRRRLLPEASRGSHVDFAAPGAEMAAAGLDGGFVAVRGTSFAAPLAAGLLARKLPEPDRAAADRAIVGLGRQALDLGPGGPDPLFGRGLVATELRVPPPDVGARFALRGP